MSAPFIRKAKPKRKEDAIQRAIVEYLKLLQKHYPLRFFAVPNGGKRSRIEAAIMKGLGTVAGAPDLVVLLGPIRSTTVRGPANGPKVFMIEVKSEKGRVSKEQNELWNWCVENKFRFSVVRSLDDVVDLLTPHIAMNRQAA